MKIFVGRKSRRFLLETLATFEIQNSQSKEGERYHYEDDVTHEEAP